jgi:MFS family permease
MTNTPYESDSVAQKVSSFGVFVMAGIACGSLLLTNLSDIYGRKSVLLVATLISSFLLVPIILEQDNYMFTVSFSFLFGMAAAVKFSVSYMYSLELTTSQNGEFYGIM